MQVAVATRQSPPTCSFLETPSDFQSFLLMTRSAGPPDIPILLCPTNVTPRPSSFDSTRSDIPLLPGLQQPPHLPLQPRQSIHLHIHPLTPPTSERTHHLVHPLLAPPLRPSSPHWHLSHHAFKRAQLRRMYPPNHVCPPPVGERLGRKHD